MADPMSLRDRLLGHDGPLAGVLDGAQFDDLPVALAAARLERRPLYLERGTGGRDRIASAPHLVDLTGGDREQRLDRVLDLVGARPAVVFWAGPPAEELFRHLRGINMVRLPRPSDRAPPADAEGVDRSHELVVFRHADANVMAQVLPALDVAAFARLMGPAERILFAPDPDWNDGRRSMAADRPEPGPRPPSGPLTLDGPTMDRITERRRETSRGRIRAYLARNVPDGMDADEAHLAAVVKTSEHSARSFGIVTEAGQGRWAYLNLMTGGRVAETPEVARFLTRPGARPDDDVETLIDAAARRAAAAT